MCLHCHGCFVCKALEHEPWFHILGQRVEECSRLSWASACITGTLKCDPSLSLSRGHALKLGAPSFLVELESPSASESPKPRRLWPKRLRRPKKRDGRSVTAATTWR